MTTVEKTEARMPCPFCREPILQGALKCRHCQSELAPLVSQDGRGDLAPRTMRHAIPRVFSKYATFSGRAVRKEFWGFFYFSFVCQFVIWTLSAGTPWEEFGQLAASAFNLAVLLPSFAVMTRRLHDVGRSGWWWLIGFTVIGLVPLIYWLAKPGEAGPNRFGPAPLVA